MWLAVVYLFGMPSTDRVQSTHVSAQHTLSTQRREVNIEEFQLSHQIDVKLQHRAKSAVSPVPTTTSVTFDTNRKAFSVAIYLTCSVETIRIYFPKKVIILLFSPLNTPKNSLSLFRFGVCKEKRNETIYVLNRIFPFATISSILSHVIVDATFPPPYNRNAQISRRSR